VIKRGHLWAYSPKRLLSFTMKSTSLPGAGLIWLALHRRVLFGVPMDFCHFGAVGEGFAVAWNASLMSIDHGGVAEDHRQVRSVVADQPARRGDSMPPQPV
jgi:hypothetical protein